MSKRTYMAVTANGQFVKVEGGWDNQLRYHFLTVTTADDQLIWSNLDQEDHNIPPLQQAKMLERMGIPVPENWVTNLSKKGNQADLYQSYGTLGWFNDSRLKVNHNPNNITSLSVNVYKRQFGKTHVLIIDDDLNQGMSAVNCIKKVIVAILHQSPKHPWLDGQQPVWVVGNANSYGDDLEAAEYAIWENGHWKFMSREALVAEIKDNTIPQWRGLDKSFGSALEAEVVKSQTNLTTS